MQFKTSEAIAAAVALAVHVVIAVGLFGLITGAAILLNLATNACEAHHLVPIFVIYGMRGLEMLLWAVDVVCFVELILVEVWKFCVRVWMDRGA